MNGGVAAREGRRDGVGVGRREWQRVVRGEVDPLMIIPGLLGRYDQGAGRVQPKAKRVVTLPLEELVDWSTGSGIGVRVSMSSKQLVQRPLALSV